MWLCVCVSIVSSKSGKIGGRREREGGGYARLRVNAYMNSTCTAANRVRKYSVRCVNTYTHTYIQTNIHTR